jgi:hypothetical protein
MEDLIAASVAPLAQVLEMADRREAYVGVFARRCGYDPGWSVNPPGMCPSTPLLGLAGADYGQTSIKHYEYMRVVERTCR